MRELKVFSLSVLAIALVSSGMQAADNSNNSDNGASHRDRGGLKANVADKGVRGGPAGAGAPLPGLSPNELASFNEGQFRMTELESICDGCSDILAGKDTGQDPLLQTITNSAGLGARFNADSCSGCHSQPAIGGSGGFFVPNPQDPPAAHRAPENPSFDLIPHRRGAANQIPPFITKLGPIREMRLIEQRDAYGRLNGTPDGGVHQLWTIVGRTDDATIRGCQIKQPDFVRELNDNNAIFRIPLQEFGLGLIDTIQDSEILAHHDATASARQALGIIGVPNRSGNDGTITRFGWKAQNKSLTMFSGEAYNVEMGVTNELFPQAVEEDPACNGPKKNHPNDVTRMGADDSQLTGFNTGIHVLADWMQFTLFMRFLDGPKPVALNASAQRGQQLFGTGPQSPGIGCVLCHTANMRTPAAVGSPALASKDVNLYSDLLIHHMGRGLADHVQQGAAKGDMFRSTPLWGVGQRRFFLHDGRTSDLGQAILAHADGGPDDNSPGHAERQWEDRFPASEANAVVAAFVNLSAQDQQAILDFLRSL